MHEGINTTLDEGQTLIANGGVFDVAHSLKGEGFDASEDGTGRGTPIVPVAFDCKGTEVQFTEDGSHPTLRSMGHNNSHQNAGGHAAVAFAQNQRGELRASDIAPQLTTGGGKPGEGHPAVAFDMQGREGGAMPEGPHDTANIRAADGGSSRSYIAQPWAVRRLTPEECEALQGFPRAFTRIPYRNKPADKCPDGPRYKALGNSMAVNVMQWVFQRIRMVDEMDVSQ